MATTKLTAKAIENLTWDPVKGTRPNGHKRPVSVATGGGLTLQISPSGAKSWVYRFRHGAKIRDLGLGSYPAVSLADARAAAHEVSKIVKAGRDPIAERVAAETAAKRAADLPTIKRIVADFIQLNRTRGAWVPEYATGWERTTKRWVLNILGDKRAEDVTPADVRAVLSQPTKDRKGKAIANTTLVHDLPKTALKVRVMLEQVFTYAVGQDYRDEDKPNPAALTGKMIAFFGVRPRQSQAPHFAALDYRQAPAFMVELREERMGPAAHCLRFIGLTSVRTKEANGATWAEFDLDSALWTIPARRMKMRKEHVVPLSRQAVDLLRGMIPGTQDEFVFPSPKDGGVLSPNAMLMLLKRMKRHGAMTPHGMRACFRTWAAEQTNYASEVAEACLAHYSGSATELAYQRGTFLEKRRQLMIAWADYLDRLPISATVTPIGAARSAS